MVMSLSPSVENPRLSSFLVSTPVGTLATVDESGQPMAAVIYFMVDPSFNFYFVSKEKTRKVQNMRKHPEVALAVYDAALQTTVQVTGSVVEVTDVSRFDTVYKGIVEAAKATGSSPLPPISKIPAGMYCLFRLEPDSIRMAEFTKPEQGSPDDIFQQVEL